MERNEFSDSVYAKRALQLACHGPHELSCGCVVCTEEQHYSHERFCSVALEIYKDYGITFVSCSTQIMRDSCMAITVELLTHFMEGVMEDEN